MPRENQARWRGDQGQSSFLARLPRQRRRIDIKSLVLVLPSIALQTWQRPKIKCTQTAGGLSAGSRPTRATILRPDASVTREGPSRARSIGGHQR